MPLIKIIKHTYQIDYEHSDTEDEIKQWSDGTAWTEVTEEDLTNFKTYIAQENKIKHPTRYDTKRTIYTLLEFVEVAEILPLTIDAIKKQMQAQKKIDDKNKATTKKRAITIAKNKEVKERHMLQKLKQKFGEQ